MNMQLSLEDKELQKLLKVLGDDFDRDVRPPFREFAQYMRVTTDNTFQKLRHGGTYRGVSWDYFAPQYTRKTDGVTVPAWGGVPKIRGSGTVKGRLRASANVRVKAGDSIVQDSGTLRARAATVLQMSPTVLRLGPKGTPLKYARYQQKARPFLFFTKYDGKMLVDIAVKQLHKALSRKGLK